METPPIDKKKVAEGLARIRKTRYKSRALMAEALGMPATRYAEYEQGRVSLPYEVAWRVADLLECSMDEVGGRDWPGAAAPGASSAQPPDGGVAASDPASPVTASPAAAELAGRIEQLPRPKRDAVRDFLDFQESQLEKNGDVSGDLAPRQARPAAS